MCSLFTPAGTGMSTRLTAKVNPSQRQYIFNAVQSQLCNRANVSKSYIRVSDRARVSKSYIRVSVSNRLILVLVLAIDLYQGQCQQQTYIAAIPTCRQSDMHLFRHLLVPPFRQSPNQWRQLQVNIGGSSFRSKPFQYYLSVIYLINSEFCL